MALIEFAVDLSSLEKLAGKLGIISDKLSSNIPEILNSVGEALHDRVVDDISDYLGVDRSEVEDAIISRAASALNPRFSIVSDSRKFRYVRWFTARDEKVCKLCGPLDGKLFLRAEALLMLPVHPNCRCTIEQVDMGSKISEFSSHELEEVMDEIVEEILKAGGFSI
jgi:SPP1 gp7 family putative phage head morphogenesis protein